MVLKDVMASGQPSGWYSFLSHSSGLIFSKEQSWGMESNMPVCDHATWKQALSSTDMVFFGGGGQWLYFHGILIESILCLVGNLTNSSKASKLENPDRLGHGIFFFFSSQFPFMHLFVNFDSSSIFQSVENTHVAPLWWTCYQQILGASTDGTGSQNLLECSSKPLQAITVNSSIWRQKRKRTLASLSSLATTVCGISALGYSLRCVYATGHILKPLHSSSFCGRYLGRFGEKVQLTNHCPYLEMQEGSLCFLFFLLSKIKQQCQEKSNLFGYKNNVMLLPT